MLCLKGQCHEIFASGFFHESSFTKSLKITKGHFPKIRADVRKSKCTTGISDTGGKFITEVYDTSGK
jgi:hypothetical protein